MAGTVGATPSEGGRRIGTMTPVAHAVCAARFLLPSAGHLALVRAALACAPRCTVAVRRAFLAPSPANPHPWEQRVRWLQAALTADERARVAIVPLREHWDDERLVRQLQAAVAAAAGDRVAWITDAPPVDAQDLPAGWSFSAAPAGDPDAALVPWLHALYEADDPAPLLASPPSALPPAAVDDLRAWIAQPAFATVRDDWRQIAHERRQWSVAPYPMVLATVDAVVQAGGHVLLIRRGRSPGKGLWALPGGFLETTEDVLHAALRELVEETGLPVPLRTMRQALRGRRVFDHPERSQRGRIITQSFHFDLGEIAPPPVHGADDAAAAQWLPIDALHALETQLHDDHFHMLDVVLGLTRDP
jgi:bifunctional NMN adenylyltransferase/nudix hydrolase